MLFSPQSVCSASEAADGDTKLPVLTSTIQANATSKERRPQREAKLVCIVSHCIESYRIVLYALYCIELYRLYRPVGQFTSLIRSQRLSYDLFSTFGSFWRLLVFAFVRG